MPSLFSRRRAGSQPPVDRIHSSAAATAASQAFLQSPANGALSAAAAAAALRSHNTTPEPVGSITTKRMERRGSVSSVGAGSIAGGSIRGGAKRPGLQRANSSGSMTERTFRSPSPGQARTNGVRSPTDDNAPPVPPLPRGVSKASHKRASSAEPSARMTSPSPARGGRGASVDRAATPNSNRARLSKRLSNVPELATEDALSRNPSVNFSRPRASPVASPTTSPSAPQQPASSKGGWFAGPAVGAVAASSPTPAKGPATAAGVSSPTSSNVGQATDVVEPRTANESQIDTATPVRSQRPVDGPSVAHTRQDDDDAMEYVMVYDPNSRSFVQAAIPKPAQPEPESEPEPASPVFADAGAPKPGTYDPATRRIVPTPQPIGTGSVTSESGLLPSAATRTTRSPAPVENKTLQPPPRNPARLSPNSSPVSTRASGFLHKQPSIVREDRDAEQQAEEAASPSLGPASRKRAVLTSAGPAKAYAASPAQQHQRSVSLDVPRGSTDGRGRGGSLSPARSARFSASPVLEAIRHNPPQRGTSPVKSAMKHSHSPASSVRTESPTATFSPTAVAVKGPGSDVSDTTSVTSAEGSATGGKKKKKSVRVSFDDDSRGIEAAGAATAPRTLNAVAESTKVRGVRIAGDDEDGADEAMKPRPALPSFGSVRRNNRVQNDVAEKVTERPPDRNVVSSDQRVGGILASNHNKAKDDNSPLPPEVTSKDAAGYASDASEDDGLASAGSTGALPSEIQKSTAASLPPPAAATQEPMHDEDVPVISLQPPTPGIDEAHKALGQQATEKDEEEEAKHTTEPKSSLPTAATPGRWNDESDESVKPLKSEPAADATSIQPPVSKSLTSPVDKTVEDESDGNEVFSDAEEDLDLGGFASMDAMVESPAITSSKLPPTATGKTATPQGSPSKKQTVGKAARTATTEAPQQGTPDWREATAYWSKLSKQQRMQIEQEHLSSDDEGRSSPAVLKRSMRKANASTVATVPPASAPNAPMQAPQTKPAPLRAGPSPAQTRPTPAQTRPSPAQADPAPAQPTQRAPPALKKSMRAPSPAEEQKVRIPQSLRKNGPPAPGGAARPQSEYGNSRGMQQDSGAARPMSATYFSTTSNSRTMSPQGAQRSSQTSAFPTFPNQKTAQPPPPASKTLSKQATNDSDSESSFKKARRTSVSTVDTQGKYSMRRSMRAGSVDSSQRVTSSTRDGRGMSNSRMQSMSPSRGAFGRDKSEQIRDSLRNGPSDASARTMRGPNSMRSRSQSQGRAGSMTASRAAPRAVSKFKSRFADSDDEDDGDKAATSRPTFRSRFSDSDEEDTNVIREELPPVRGIPRRKGQQDGDSTDLEDEDELDASGPASKRKGKGVDAIVADPEAVEKAMEAARRNLGLSSPKATGTGTSAKEDARHSPRQDATPASAMPEKKKRGLVDSLLRRNKNSSQSVQRVESPTPASLASPGVETPATPKNPTQETAQETAQEASPSSPASPSQAKLIRRHSGQPRMRRGNSSLSTATAPAMYGRTASMTNRESENWPLPATSTPPMPPLPPKGILSRDSDRPGTSDGGGEPGSSRMSVRGTPGRAASGRVGFADDVDAQSEAGETVVGGESHAVYSQRTGKKKKFSRLRKAFGLYD